MDVSSLGTDGTWIFYAVKHFPDSVGTVWLESCIRHERQMGRQRVDRQTVDVAGHVQNNGQWTVETSLRHCLAVGTWVSRQNQCSRWLPRLPAHAMEACRLTFQPPYIQDSCTIQIGNDDYQLSDTFLTFHCLSTPRFAFGGCKLAVGWKLFPSLPLPSPPPSFLSHLGVWTPKICF